jgi:ribose 5-phosphate isomerase B
VKQRVALGADDDGPLLDAVAETLATQGFEVERVATGTWGPMARVAAERVANGEVRFAVIACWTGTGVSMVANKVPGVRAALCADAPTAAGARAWNDANVLCLSLRLTTPHVAKEIIEAWVATAHATSEGESRACMADLDAGRVR